MSGTKFLVIVDDQIVHKTDDYLEAVAKSEQLIDIGCYYDKVIIAVVIDESD